MDERTKIQELIRISEEIRRDDSKSFTFFKNREPLRDEKKEDIDKSNAWLFDLENTPHIFVLGCVMDLGIKFELAWMMPYKVISAFIKLNYIQNNSIDELATIDLKKYEYVFTSYYSKNLHRYNYMAKRFRDAVLLINQRYKSNASKIWSGKPSAGTVAKRFEEFEGVGQKISTMAAKILGGKFEIEFSDYSDLDIPVDRQVIRVMRRLGLIKYESNDNIFKKKIIHKTREWKPDYPGLFDYACFRAGINYCKPENPECNSCILKNICNKNI
jgi:endonuclease III